jgi:hypothetical protein
VLSSYRAPQGCPSQQEYVESVESRSATLRLLPESAAVAGSDRVRVRIQPDTDSAGWVGELRIEGAESLEREVRGERCQDVALALALITVLRLDRREAEAPGAPPPRVPSTNATVSAVRPAPAAPSLDATPAAPLAVAPAAPPPTMPTAPVAPPAAEAPAALAPAAPLEPIAPPGVGSETATPEPTLPEEPFEIVRRQRPEPESVEAGAEPREVTASGARELGLSLAAHIGYAAVPSHALQARLRAGLELGPVFHDASLALGLGYAVASDRTEAADLGFRLLTAQLELCPASRLWGGLWLQACGQLSAGAWHVSVSARDLSLETKAQTLPWFALGPSLHAGLPLASGWSLRALAAGSVLLVRDRLEVERSVGGGTGEPTVVERSTLYRPPLLSVELLLGLGYAF